MSGHWEFNELDPSNVRVGVTQRDQFNNDDVGLADALVREAIQNSSDAWDRTAPVRVRFTIKVLNRDEKEQLAQELVTLAPHLEACNVEQPDYKNGTIRILCIEDFNTTGLTGSFEDLDRENFCNFWRAMGESEKRGQQGGRWGLGKLVYSSASEVRSFFGLTIREGDHCPSMMGQAVLAHHIINDAHYPIHGFWFDERSRNGLRLQLPVTDKVELGRLKTLFSITRTDQRGLSLVIPCLIEGISEETILSGIVNNFYFPVLAGTLELEVGDISVNASTFLNLESRVKSKLSNVPLSFVQEVSEAMKSDTKFRTVAPIGDTKLSADHLSEDEIDTMKAVFASGGLVHVRASVGLERSDRTREKGEIGLFLKALNENEGPFSLFARGPIVLPGERRHSSGVIARAAMIAYDGAASEFLGDAENPAHTGWNANAEKLRDRWCNAQATLRNIRSALRDFYATIADQSKRHEEDALIDFFSLADKAEGMKGKKKRVRKPKPDPPPQETAIRITPNAGGFRCCC